jgi:hypothetical protein
MNFSSCLGHILGSCDVKKFVCSSENFNPNALVCGTNGKIYENRCLFEKEQCVTAALKEDTNCVKNMCLLVYDFDWSLPALSNLNIHSATFVARDFS